MEYLRNLGTVAASSLLQKSGIAYPFVLGERIGSFDGQTIWTLYDALKKEDSSLISVFVFDGNSPHNKERLPLAKNALRKLKTIRHPNILTYIDSFETDSAVYVVTGRVKPLTLVMDEEELENPDQREQWLLWGLERISQAIAFINGTVGANHGNIGPRSIFVSCTGEWQLGGFEILTVQKSDEVLLYNSAELLPNAQLLVPPEVKVGGWNVLRDVEVGSIDAYCLGLLLHSLFNRRSPPPSSTNPPFPPPTLSARGSIPRTLFPVYKKLLHPKPASRLRVVKLNEIGMSSSDDEGGGFFLHNKLVSICARLDGLPLASDDDKLEFLRSIDSVTASLPTSFRARRVLPSLMTTLEHGGSVTSAILPVAFKLARILPPADYLSIVVLPAVRLFSNQDRTVRMALLDALPEFVDKTDVKLVSEQVWPHFQSGFADTMSILREATVRSVLHIYPKLSDRILNNELLRHLAKMQSDPEASIRTNTCILIGRLAPSLGTSARRKVLAPAFAKAVKDNFVHARVAGLAAFLATVDCFEPGDIASKVLPVVVTVLIDQEKVVRDQAFKTLDIYVKKLETHSSTMPESASSIGDLHREGEQRAISPNSIVTTAAGTLAGWTLTSIGRRVASGNLPGSAIVNGSMDHSAIPTQSKTATSQSMHASNPHALKSMQLPKTKIDDLSDLTDSLHHDVESQLIDLETGLDDWGSFEISTPSTTTNISSSPGPSSGFKMVNPNLLGRNIPADAKITPTKPPLSNSSMAGTLPPCPELAPVSSSEVTGSVAISKEEKLVEMARRKEERRQRIANLKQQNSISKG